MSLKREIAELRAWVEREKNHVEENRRVLDAYASGNDTIGRVASRLLALAAFSGGVGSLRVLDGDDGGFADLDLSLVYLYWRIRFLHDAFVADTQPTKQPRVTMDSAAICWMHASAIGAKPIVEWLTERIRGMEGLKGKDLNPLCSLVAHFVTGRDYTSLEKDGWAPIGAYRIVAERSFSSSDYEVLATYHVKRRSGAGFPEFASNPYPLNAFELLAIERLTGVPIENPKHEIMRTPLFRRRDVPEIPVPPDLAMVIKRATQTVA